MLIVDGVLERPVGFGGRGGQTASSMVAEDGSDLVWLDDGSGTIKLTVGDRGDGDRLSSMRCVNDSF